MFAEGHFLVRRRHTQSLIGATFNEAVMPVLQGEQRAKRTALLALNLGEQIEGH